MKTPVASVDPTATRDGATSEESAQPPPQRLHRQARLASRRQAFDATPRPGYSAATWHRDRPHAAVDARTEASSRQASSFDPALHCESRRCATHSHFARDHQVVNHQHRQHLAIRSYARSPRTPVVRRRLAQRPRHPMRRLTAVVPRRMRRLSQVVAWQRRGRTLNRCCAALKARRVRRSRPAGARAGKCRAQPMRSPTSARVQSPFRQTRAPRYACRRPTCIEHRHAEGDSEATAPASTAADSPAPPAEPVHHRTTSMQCRRRCCAIPRSASTPRARFPGAADGATCAGCPRTR